MSVYISGVEMPTSCYKCPLKRRESMTIVCPVAHEMFSVADVNILDYRLDNCPLVPVPPHGRLGDLDELKAKGYALSALRIEKDNEGRLKGWRELVPFDEAPTVIPADPVKEEQK